MISNSLLKLVSCVLLAAMSGVLAWEISRKNPAVSTPEVSADTRAADGDLAVKAFAPGSKSVRSDSESDEASIVESAPALFATGSRLSVGIMGAAPSQSEIVTLSKIPWLTSQINRAFRDAEYAACQLLTPDLPLDPILASSQLGARRSLGRIPVFTVGLEMEDSAIKKLPTATKGPIQAYLRDHRLAVEPTIYESEEGKLYFGTDCRAAFYQIASPTRTVDAEPMIDEAIGRFRSLGVLGGALAVNRRTLLMAFRFVKSVDRITSITAGSDPQIELLFLHMDAEATAKNLTFSAFVTSEERQVLHKLAMGRVVLREPLPTITATIRFDSFVMMGLYPSQPVVTGVRHQASGSLPVTTIHLLTNESTTSDHLTFEAVLDSFDELSRRSDLPK